MFVTCGMFGTCLYNVCLHYSILTIVNLAENIEERSPEKYSGLRKIMFFLHHLGATQFLYLKVFGVP